MTTQMVKQTRLTELQSDLSGLMNGNVKPSKIVGAGYKNPKQVAAQWLRSEMNNESNPTCKLYGELELLKKFGITDDKIEANRKRSEEALSKATQEELLALHKLSIKPSPLTESEKNELKALRTKVCGS